MPDVLSTQQTQHYEQDGFLFPIPILSEAEVTRYRAAFDAVEAHVGGTLTRLDLGHLYFRWAYDLATHPALVNAVAAVLGPDLLVQATLIFCKYPGNDAFVSWHQDSVYLKWHLTPSISAWLALTDSTIQSGCMRVIPGSHREGLQPHVEVQSANNLLRRGEQVRVAVNEEEAIDMELRAGQMSLHHNTIIHGSNPNMSGARRIGFIVRFVTPQLRESPFPVIQVRGHHDISHLPVLDAPPAPASTAESYCHWQRYMAQRKRTE